MADLSDSTTMTILYANATVDGMYDSRNNDSFLMKDNGSFDTAQWLRDHLGYQTSENAVTYTIVYGLLFVLGVFGNVSTVIVIVLARRRSGWTGIDAYLLNLAFTDLLLLSGIPVEIYRYWRQYPWIFGTFCCKSLAFFQEISLYVSILTIVAFTYERYLVVKDPLKALSSFTHRRRLKVIIGVWLFSAVNAFPYAHFTSVNYGHDPDGNIISQSAWCAIHYSISTQLAPLFIYSSVSFYIVPLLVLTVLYVSIAVFMRDVRKSQQSTPSQSPTAAGYGSARKKSKKSKTYLNRHESQLLTHNRQKSLKVLLAIVANFFLCYGLFHAQRMVFVLVDWSQTAGQYYVWNTYLFPLSGFLYHANPVLDPVFYSLMSRRFQHIYRQIFCCKKDRREKELSTRSHGYSHSQNQTPRTPPRTVNGSYRTGNTKAPLAAQETTWVAQNPRPTVPAMPDEDEFIPVYCSTTV